MDGRWKMPWWPAAVLGEMEVPMTREHTVVVRDAEPESWPGLWRLCGVYVAPRAALGPVRHYSLHTHRPVRCHMVHVPRHGRRLRRSASEAHRGSASADGVGRAGGWRRESRGMNEPWRRWDAATASKGTDWTETV